MYEDAQALRGELEDKGKTEHSRNAISHFFLFAIFLMFLTEKRFLSFSFGGFLLVGMFCASIISIPTYLMRILIVKRMLKHKLNDENAKCLGFFYRLIRMGYDFLVTWMLFHFFQVIVP